MFQPQSFDIGYDGINPRLIVVNSTTSMAHVVMGLNKDRSAVTVFDINDLGSMSSRKWMVNGNGYVYTHGGETTMHSAIMGERPSSEPTIDHISTIKTDNRRSNLRFATQSVQNSNRGIRGDRASVVPGLHEYGITSMPRFMRWDHHVGRFTFMDYPGVKSDYNGTRSSKCSLAGKYLDALIKYITFIEESGNVIVAADDHYARQKELIEEYCEIIRVAHHAYPDYFPAAPRVDHLWAPSIDLRLAREQRDRLVAAGVEVNRGSGNRQVVGTFLFPLESGDECMVRVRKASGGDIPFVIYDAQFEDVLRNVTWSADLRVCVGEGAKKRYRLATYIWCNVAQRVLPEDKDVGFINEKVNDCRIANLQLRNRMRNGKRPRKETNEGDIGGQLWPANIDVGMRYIPPCIELSKVGLKIKDGRNNELYKKCFDAKAATSQDLRDKIVDVLDRARQLVSDFDAMNATYQKLRAEYDEVDSAVRNGEVV